MELTSYGPKKEPCETLSKHIYVFITFTLPIIAQFWEGG